MKPLEQELDAKYAEMWIQANVGKIPRGAEPLRHTGELTEREVGIYSEACWHVLQMMAEDALITRKSLRAAHERANGWPSGRSKITEGYIK